MYLILYRSKQEFRYGSYTEGIKFLFSDYYRLPVDHSKAISKCCKKNEQSESETSYSRNDELFIWSLLLYSGKEKEEEKETKLIWDYWSLSTYPIACCLIAMLFIKRLQRRHFVPDELKEKLNNLSRFTIKFK